MSATPAETQRTLEMWVELAAKYQTERNKYRALLQKCATALATMQSNLAHTFSSGPEDLPATIYETERMLASYLCVDRQDILALLRALADLQAAGVEPKP